MRDLLIDTNIHTMSGEVRGPSPAEMGVEHEGGRSMREVAEAVIEKGKAGLAGYGDRRVNMTVGHDVADLISALRDNRLTPEGEIDCPAFYDEVHDVPQSDYPELIEQLTTLATEEGLRPEIKR